MIVSFFVCFSFSDRQHSGSIFPARDLLSPVGKGRHLILFRPIPPPRLRAVAGEGGGVSTGRPHPSPSYTPSTGAPGRTRQPPPARGASPPFISSHVSLVDVPCAFRIARSGALELFGANFDKAYWERGAQSEPQPTGLLTEWLVVGFSTHQSVSVFFSGRWVSPPHPSLHLLSPMRRAGPRL